VQPRVVVADANGAAVTSDNVTVVTLSKDTSSTGVGNLTCLGGVSQTVSAGTGTFDGCVLDQPGSYIIDASGGGLSPVKSNQIVVAQPTRPVVAILIQGQNSKLDASVASAGVEGDSPNYYGTFHQPGGIEQFLNQHGWKGVPLLEYSYTSGKVSAQGQWQPNSYGCDDTFNTPIAAAAQTLYGMVKDYLSTSVHANTDIYLVGHSEGGLVGFGLLAYLASKGWPTLPNNGRIAGLVTLDSPLGGIPPLPTFPINELQLYEQAIAVVCPAVAGPRCQP
jgi:pimeloyl-ACP methyl ester carboxylesterase